MSDRVARGSGPGRKNRSSNPGLPGVVLALGFVVVGAAPLIAARLSGIEPAERVQELATGFGLSGLALIVLQFLSSGRYEVLSGRVGIDRTMGFHRIASLALLGAAVLHPLLYVLATGIVEPALAWPRLQGMVTSPRFSTGMLALAGLGILVGMAVMRDRLPFRYEIWRGTHGAMAIGIVGLSVHHAMTVGSYSREWPLLPVWIGFVAVTVAAVMLNYVVRPSRMWREHWRVVDVQAQGEGLWGITLEGPAVTALDFRPGQFIWMTLHPHRPPLHDHPFSIASAPGDLPMLRLIVRESGDCTRDFGMIALGTQVAIDGPHGSFVLRDGGNRVVMIAGGVGIAPILGMLEHAALVGDRREFRLLFAARSGGMLPGLSRIAELGRCLDLKTEIFIDQPPLVEGARPGPIRGEDIADAVGDPERTSAYVCGPQGLMSAVTDMLLDAGLQARDVHYERFDYGAGGGRIDRARQGQAVATLAAVGAAVVAFSLT